MSVFVFLRFKGFEPSSLGGRAIPLAMSVTCEALRAFWAAPNIPSLLILGVLMLGVRCILKSLGDFKGVTPLGIAVRVAFGISIVKFSRLGMWNRWLELPIAEGGDSPVEDGDML